MTTEDIIQKFPPPKKHPVFVRTWTALLPEVAAHEKFRQADLIRLEDLCDLYVEKDQLRDILDTVGYTYEVVDSRGARPAVRPEAAALSKCNDAILRYSRSLGLYLKEPKQVMKEKEADEWE